jgi:uncharacterized protein YggE
VTASNHSPFAFVPWKKVSRTRNNVSERTEKNRMKREQTKRARAKTPAAGAAEGLPEQGVSGSEEGKRIDLQGAVTGEYRFQGNLIRAFYISGCTWFVAAEVCQALELTNSRMMVKSLDPDERGVSQGRKPMRLAICVLLAATVATQSAIAQTCLPPATANGPPILHLAESATINVTPSLLVADLLASSDAPAAVTAQRHVNNLMAQASNLAGKVPGLKAVFQDYSTSFIDRSNGVPAHWIANQTLELRGTNSEALLSLVAQLQGLGMTIGNLGWQVPQDEMDAAGRKARLEALTKLRQEASDAAGTLGMSVAGYQDIDLTGGSSPPTPFFARPRPMMMAAMAAPIATPDAQDVTATVAADAILKGQSAGH